MFLRVCFPHTTYILCYSSFIVSPLFEREVKNAETQILHMCFPFCVSMSHGDLATSGRTAEVDQSSPVLRVPAALITRSHSETILIFHEFLLHFPSLNLLSFTRYADSRQHVYSFWFQFLNKRIIIAFSGFLFTQHASEGISVFP